MDHERNRNFTCDAFLYEHLRDMYNNESTYDKSRYDELIGSRILRQLYEPSIIVSSQHLVSISLSLRALLSLSLRISRLTHVSDNDDSTADTLGTLTGHFFLHIYIYTFLASLNGSFATLFTRSVVYLRLIFFPVCSRLSLHADCC